MTDKKKFKFFKKCFNVIYLLLNKLHLKKYLKGHFEKKAAFNKGIQKIFIYSLILKLSLLTRDISS